MNPTFVDELDREINTLLRGAPEQPGSEASYLHELLLVAEQLRNLPRKEFRERLQADLQNTAARMAVARCLEGATAGAEVEKRPLSSAGRYSVDVPQFQSLSFHPIPRLHLATSFALHVAILAGILSSGLWVMEHRSDMSRRMVRVLEQSPYLLAPAHHEAHGGGGGGDRDVMPASKGTPPRLAEQQIVPPSVIVRNEAPELPAEPTLVGPPDLHLPQSAQAGDPLANVLPPSNGSGSGAGIGSGQDGGVGSGIGPGLGAGEGGGLGGGIFDVGGGVTAPRPVYDPDPEYSEEARRAKYQGSVLLEAVISPDGRPRDLQILRSLGMGLDQKALEAVNRWRFEPASKDGHPVAVRVQIEVAFRLY